MFEPVTKSIKDVTEDVRKTMVETSKENDKALTNLNSKLLNITKDRGLLASDFFSPLSKITNPEHTSQFKLVKDPDSNRVNDLLINQTILVTLDNNLLLFRDTDKKLELNGDLLKIITIKNFNVDLADLPDEKIMFELGEEMYFDEKALGNESTRDKSLIRLVKSPAIMAPGVSTIILPGYPDEL